MLTVSFLQHRIAAESPVDEPITTASNIDLVELNSIDSYKLSNPDAPAPKPPHSFWQLASSGPATLKAVKATTTTRSPPAPVAVTISEYRTTPSAASAQKTQSNIQKITAMLAARSLDASAASQQHADGTFLQPAVAKGSILKSNVGGPSTSGVVDQRSIKFEHD